jgi:dephospho-CoA kinase
MFPGLTVVGLTGGIASGKTTVARFLRETGVPVLDADSLGHLVLEPGGASHQAVVEHFGKEILADDGETIDRQKLGGLVFGDPERRAELEALTHPAIAALARRGLELIAERGERLAVYEAALLVETGVHKSLGALIVVSCSLANQVERLCARDRLTPHAAAARIASQLPLEQKVKVADYVIENDEEFDSLQRQTRDVLSRIRTRFEIEEAS